MQPLDTMTPAISALLDQVTLDPGRLIQGLSKASGSEKTGKIKKTSEDFEAVFYRILLKEFRKTIPESGLFSHSVREDIYQDMIDWNLAQEMAKQGTLGIGKMIYEDLMRREKLENPIKEQSDMVENVID